MALASGSLPMDDAQKRLAYVAIRYSAAAVVALETILFSRALGPERFGPFALTLQVSTLLTFVGFGAASGYAVEYFRDDDQQRRASVDDEYLSVAPLQHVSGAAAVGVVLAVAWPTLLPGVALFVIQIPYLVVEPMLRVRGRFAAATVARLAGPAASIMCGGAVWLMTRRSPWVVEYCLAASIAGNVLGYGATYVWLRRQAIRFRAAALRRSLRPYWLRILRPGIPLNVSAVSFLLYTYVDRLALRRLQAASELSSYSLAWQLAQGGALLLASLNVVSGVRVGEAAAAGDTVSLRRLMVRQLMVNAWAGLVVVGGVVIATVGLHRTLFRDFVGLIPLVALFSLGLAAYNVAGSVTCLLFYRKRAGVLNLTYAAVLVAAILANTLFRGALGGRVFPVASVGIATLIAGSIFLIFRSFAEARGEVAT